VGPPRDALHADIGEASARGGAECSTLVERIIPELTVSIMPTALTFKILRLLSDAQFHSGPALAKQLGVSRAGVSSALRELDTLGIEMTRDPRRGYRLAAPIDWLDAVQIKRHLGAHAAKFDLSVLDMAASTNTTLLKTAAHGAPSGSVVVAELQTAGRGRRGRAWHTGLGGALTFSVLWRFEQGAGVLAGLGPAVGVALVRALRSLGVGDAALKWPNDVLVSHQKVAGTLVEIQGDVLGPSFAVIGVGVNHRLDPATRQRIDQAVVDLYAAGVLSDRNRVLAELLRHLGAVLETFSGHGFGPLRKEWEGFHVYAGRRVALRLPDGSFQQGIAAGVSDDGALLLQTDTGLRRYHSGEVSLRPIKLVSEPRSA
jgi:BirA family biotin operon repressor/biotin-[acetyl-CoA-carboxylase] ligase